MSLKRPAKDQPENFEFNSSSLEAAKIMIAKYPKGKQQSAVMALLYIAQKQNENWIPLAASSEEELNSKFSGWSLAGLFKLIYQPLQKQCLKIPI